MNQTNEIIFNTFNDNLIKATNIYDSGNKILDLIDMNKESYQLFLFHNIHNVDYNSKSFLKNNKNKNDLTIDVEITNNKVPFSQNNNNISNINNNSLFCNIKNSQIIEEEVEEETSQSITNIIDNDKQLNNNTIKKQSLPSILLNDKIKKEVFKAIEEKLPYDFLFRDNKKELEDIDKEVIKNTNDNSNFDFRVKLFSSFPTEEKLEKIIQNISQYNKNVINNDSSSNKELINILEIRGNSLSGKTMLIKFLLLLNIYNRDKFKKLKTNYAYKSVFCNEDSNNKSRNTIIDIVDIKNEYLYSSYKSMCNNILEQKLLKEEDFNKSTNVITNIRSLKQLNDFLKEKLKTTLVSNNKDDNKDNNENHVSRLLIIDSLDYLLIPYSNQTNSIVEEIECFKTKNTGLENNRTTKYKVNSDILEFNSLIRELLNITNKKNDHYKGYYDLFLYTSNNNKSSYYSNEANNDFTKLLPLLYKSFNPRQINFSSFNKNNFIKNADKVVVLPFKSIVLDINVLNISNYNSIKYDYNQAKMLSIDFVNIDTSSFCIIMSDSDANKEKQDTKDKINSINENKKGIVSDIYYLDNYFRRREEEI